MPATSSPEVLAVGPDLRPAPPLLRALPQESALLTRLQVTSPEAQRACTPTLRGLQMRARIADVRAALSPPADPLAEPDLRPSWPEEITFLAQDARNALIEDILSPLVGEAPDQIPDARRLLRLAAALLQVRIEARAAWREVERLGQQVELPPRLWEPWAETVCTLLHIEAEGWRRSTQALLPGPILAGIDPEVPRHWALLRALHTRLRGHQPAAARRLACLLATCEALRTRRLQRHQGDPADGDLGSLPA